MVRETVQGGDANCRNDAVRRELEKKFPELTSYFKKASDLMTQRAAGPSVGRSTAAGPAPESVAPALGFSKSTHGFAAAAAAAPPPPPPPPPAPETITSGPFRNLKAVIPARLFMAPSAPVTDEMGGGGAAAAAAVPKEVSTAAAAVAAAATAPPTTQPAAALVPAATLVRRTEQENLEKVIDMFHPALRVVNGQYEAPSSKALGLMIAAKESKIRTAIRSVGRVNIAGEHIGTAWMISETTAITNRHVNQGIQKLLAINPSHTVSVDFYCEAVKAINPPKWEVNATIIWTADDNGPDVGFLRLETTKGLPEPISLLKLDKYSLDLQLGVIGYPQANFDINDPNHDTGSLVEAAYGNRPMWGKKYFSPGSVTGGVENSVFLHNASTLSGNSGSVVIDLTTGLAIGIHNSGWEEHYNTAYDVQSIIDSFANAKIKETLTVTTLAEVAAADNNAVPTPAPAPAAALAAAPAATPATTAAAGAGAAARKPSSGAGGAAPAGPSAELTVGTFKGLKGFDENFLDAPIPLPKLTDTQKALLPKVQDAPDGVLRYRNYSVLFNTERKFAFCTAVNIDGSQSKQFGRKDNWFKDPRFPSDQQFGHEFYKGTEFNRGHLVRRIDPSWGSDADAEQADRLTFSFANCTPQHSVLNQQTWQSLETYILESHAKREKFKTCVFTGPIFTDDDPEFKGARIPFEFWKIAVMRDTVTSELAAAGYVLSQKDLITDLEFAFGEFKTYQVAIEEIEKRTKLDFGTLRQFDTLRGLTTEAVEINSPDDMVLQPPGLKAKDPELLAELIRKRDAAAEMPTMEKVVNFLHPGLRVRHGKIEKPESTTMNLRFLGQQKNLDKAITSVGRVNLNGAHFGTAWMVTGKVAITNRHVTKGLVERGGAITIDFLQEAGLTATWEVSAKVLWKGDDDGPDIGFLLVEDTAGKKLPPPITLLDLSSVPLGKMVGIVGYPLVKPFGSDADDLDLVAKAYGDRPAWSKKYFSPGFVIEGADDTGLFLHDATTLRGNSGSVVLDIDTGLAIGIHNAGVERQWNSAFSVQAIKQVFAANVRGLGDLQIAQPEVAAVPGARRMLVEEAVIRRRTDEFKGVKGFDENFLGVKIPLPKLTSEQQELLPEVQGANDNVLRYIHYSVLFNSERGFPFCTAVNIDGATAVDLPRKNLRDEWFKDPRISESIQHGNEIYKGSDFDQGHLVRRLDPVWGPQAQAALAERFTFSYANCTLQHRTLNQRTWLSLEKYILENHAKPEQFKACVFSGPVFGAHDPVFRGVQVPFEFWKVAVMRDTESNELVAAGYKLSQRDLISELEFAFGEFKTYQVKITDIEKLTGLDFGNLRNFDPLAGQPSREINGPEDVNVKPKSKKKPGKRGNADADNGKKTKKKAPASKKGKRKSGAAADDDDDDDDDLQLDVEDGEEEEEEEKEDAEEAKTTKKPRKSATPKKPAATPKSGKKGAKKGRKSVADDKIDEDDE